MVPLSWLSSRTRPQRLAKSPKLEGMIPLSWLPPRARFVRLTKLPKLEGMLPLSWLPPRLILVTLPWTTTFPLESYDTPWTITPNQLDAPPLSQPALLFHLDPPVWLYKSTKALYSAVGIW